MFELASRLSQDIGFVRVDLYNTNGRTYCGELTLSPVGGIFQFTPDELGFETRGEMGSGIGPLRIRTVLLVAHSLVQG